MAIIQTVNFSMFRRAFDLAGRSNQFCDEALEAIFSYLESISDSTGSPVELDVIGICVEYTESTVEDVNSEYNLMIEKEDDEKEDDFQKRMNEYVVDFIEKNSVLILNKNGILVFQNF